MFIDTHCHLNDERFSLQTDEIVGGYLQKDVDTVLNIGYDMPSSEKGLVLAEKYPSVYFAVGIHPSDIATLDQTAEKRLKELSTHNKCIAIGEIGLDYHYEGFDKQNQIEGFVRQIELADQVQLPISVHSRDAAADSLDILKSHRNGRGGVMHCYSGSKETAKILLDAGLYISFAGTLTFKNAKNLTEVCSYAPFDRILSETDSPYLAPVPFRGQTNKPEYIPLVVEYIARIKGVSTKKAAEIIKNNAKTLFYKLKT